MKQWFMDHFSKWGDLLHVLPDTLTAWATHLKNPKGIVALVAAFVVAADLAAGLKSGVIQQAIKLFFDFLELVKDAVSGPSGVLFVVLTAVIIFGTVGVVSVLSKK